MLRVVHSQHKMTWNNLLRSGDKIHITATIANMEQHGAHDTMDLKIILTRRSKTVVEMLYQLLVRGKQKTGEKIAIKQAQIIETGERLGEQSIMISEDQGVRYAKASGDYNPIHINEEIAKKAGFPKIIIHGLCTMAFASKAIVDILLGETPSRLKFMSARFLKPVLMGQTLTTELYDKGMIAERHIVHFITYNADGIPVLTYGVAEYID